MSQSNNRFWEFYFVRYFVGTMLGAGIIYFLSSSQNSPLNQVIISGLPSVGNLKWEGLVLLSALGLAYCYIASAPILVLHATRSFFTADNNKIYNGTLFFLLFLIGGAAFLFSDYRLQSDRYWTYLILAIVLTLQVVPLVMAFMRSGRSLHSFYIQLTNARSTNNKASNEYIESYRHLREHGNAFLIIVLELGLAAILWSSNDSNTALLMVLIWVAPAAFVWFLANLLETNFSNDQST